MNSYNQHGNAAFKRTMSPLGAVIYAIAATILGVMSVLCLRTNGEEALYCFSCPVLLFGAGYFATVLATHKKTATFIVSCVSCVVAASLLTFNPILSIVCLGAFLSAWAVSVCLERSDMTQSGIMLASLSIYAAFFLYALCILCYQKYGSVSFDKLSGAFDSFCNVMLQAPKDALAEMKETYTDPSYAEAISSYEKTITHAEKCRKMY